MPLTITTVSTVEGFREVAPEWDLLFARARCAMPYQLPAWLLAWWEAFRHEGIRLRDELRVKIVRDASSGELVGVVPFVLTERPAVGPFRVRALALLGSDPYITEQRAPVVDPAREAEVARALVRDLKNDPSWDWIVWSGLEKTSPFASEIDGSLGITFGHVETQNLLALPPTWDLLKSSLPRNTREALRHAYNAPKREKLDLAFRVAESPVDVDRALEVFFRLHSMRAEQVGTVAHPNRFGTRRARDFLRLACARLAEGGRARVFMLEIGGKPVAARVGFLLPDCLYLYYSGFDPAWRKHSVMLRTTAEALRYAIGQGASRAHLSMGTDPSKTRFRPQTSLLQEGLTIRRTLRAELVARAFWASRRSALLERLLGRVLRRHFA